MFCPLLGSSAFGARSGFDSFVGHLWVVSLGPAWKDLALGTGNYMRGTAATFHCPELNTIFGRISLLWGLVFGSDSQKRWRLFGLAQHG